MSDAKVEMCFCMIDPQPIPASECPTCSWWLKHKESAALEAERRVVQGSLSARDEALQLVREHGKKHGN